VVINMPFRPPMRSTMGPFSMKDRAYVMVPAPKMMPKSSFVMSFVP